MLLKFTVTNYKGIRDKLEFDLMATNGSEYSNSLYEINENLKVNSAMCLIGPNGSGKTHLLEAISDFANAMADSEELKYAHQPFILDDIHPTLPTIYEALIYDEENSEFLIYSFSSLSGKVISESLEIKKNTSNAKPISIFTRDLNKINFPKNKPIQKLLTDTLSAGGLIVTFASSIKHKQVNFLHSWSLGVLYGNTNIFDMNANNLLNQSVKNLIKSNPDDLTKHDDFLAKNVFPTVTNVLQSLDLPIEEVTFKKAEDQSYYITITPKTLSIKKNSLNMSDSNNYFSEGTFNAITLVISICLMPYSNILYLFDEYDASLHHKLSVGLLKFIRDSINRNKNQIIISTHDLTLLDQGFRRDSIFILSKDDNLSTKISRVADFSIRKDAKVSLKYLNNEFGALPKIFEGVSNE